MPTTPKVSIGPASVLGWLAAAAALLTAVVQSLQGSQALASGPGKWPAILGVVVLAATNLGRQFQAAHLTKAAQLSGDADVPAALQALSYEAHANAAQKGPDGVDSPAVPFSGAPAPPAAAAQG